MTAQNGNGDTAEKLAATREDLARFEGRVMTELRGLHTSIAALRSDVAGQGDRLNSLDTRLGRMEAEHAAADRYAARYGRRWDRWREWLAYLTALGAVVWNVFQSRNGGG